MLTREELGLRLEDQKPGLFQNWIRTTRSI